MTSWSHQIGNFVSGSIQQNKKDFLKKVMIYFLKDTVSKILHTQWFIMMKKHHICIWVLFQCVMVDCKEKMCSIVKSYEIGRASCRERVQDRGVAGETDEERQEEGVQA